MYDSGRYSPINSDRGLDFIGWLDQNPLPINVDGVTVQAKTSQVLVVRLPVSYESHEGETHFFLPGPYFWPESSSNESGLSPITNRSDRLDEVCITKGAVIAQYRLPAEQTNLRASRMLLYLNSVTANSQRNPLLPDHIELYEWQTGKWQPLSNPSNSALPTTGGTNSPPPKPNEIPNPIRYIDPQTGRILLRFSLDSSSVNVLTQFSLSVEGTR
jgi:hypothetical protein